MVSNQILQQTIEGIKNISRVDLCVTDAEGKTIASTIISSSNYQAEVLEFVKSPADSQEIQNSQYFKIFDEQNLEYIVICASNGDNAYLVGKMAAFQIQSLTVAYKERFDKDNFIKNLLLDNLLLVDIYGYAKRLHISLDASRVVLLVDSSKCMELDCLSIVREVMNSNKHDFVSAVDEKNVVIIKEIQEDLDKEIEAASASILEALAKEGAEGVRISYGTCVSEIKDVSRSYKEAKMALDVGGIFFEEREVIAYSELGIGRLIYQLPIPLCKMFIKEIFHGINPEDFDEDTIITIKKFFENSLNVSETSRQLFIHRNTLVYRLDKIQKSTGLDLRVFEDAITFRIALMVVKYMKYMETIEY
ncbi:MAG: helix-turn-helix domain-containing protein [Lachnospiraceae bacterium]|nr:helix-turn-helix domain-containing protein [Lachnospiraceae bacterium]